MRRHFVGDWSNDNQPQKPSGGAASPEDVIEDFVTNHATFGSEIYTGLLPIQAIGFADVFGCEDLGGIFAPRFGRSREAEPRIFAATGQHVDFRNGRFEEGLITEAAIDGHQQGPIRSAFLVQQLAKVFNQAQGGGGQILILARGTVLLQLVFSSCFARLAHNRYMLKADRKRASRKVALLIMRKRQRCLEESQSPNEVDMEGGRHRIAVPGCSGNVFARLMDLRVIHRHHDRTLGIPLQILINDGIKQLFRLPGTPRKKLIVGVPVLLGAAQYTDALGNGAVAHGCWPSQRVLDCTPVRAAIGENIPPALLQHRDIVLGQRHGCPPLRVKTFLSLRRNRSPRAIFLTSEDTTDSRSRRRPCSFSIRSRISEIWRGLPVRRSTSCTISSCDVRLSPAGSAVVLDFARRIARSWASRAISKALSAACSIGYLSSAVFFMADISCAKTCGNGAILRYVCQYNSVVDLRKCLNSSPLLAEEGTESLLQPFCEILSQLVHLWLRDVNDIRLVRIPCGVILVILFRWIKGLEGLECRDDRVCEDAGFVQLTNVSFGNPLLLVVRVKNRRAILPPDVVPLPI